MTNTNYNKEQINKLLKIVLIFAISCCCVLMLPQIRSFIIEIAEKVLGRDLDNSVWMKVIFLTSLFAIFYFGIFLALLTKKCFEQIINYHYFPKIMMLVLLIGISILISIQAYLNAAYINPVSILKTSGTFFIFLISFSLTWIFVLQKMKDWRSSFIVAFIYFGIYVWLLAEVLSFFKILTPSGILCGWIAYIIVSLTFIIRLYKTGKIQLRLPQIYPFQLEYVVIAVIISITFFTAVAYPPNNWDSMTYHLPRIEHWLQNKNLNHYYTSIDRQLFSAPFAEILILHGRALSGDDYLVNLVQWFSLLGSIIGISKIVSHLGMNRKMQITAALFFATVPMAVLQASSTQTDLVETFCIICMAERFLAWRKNGTLFESITFGFILGLSILTKGTAYPIALPFVLCFAVISIKYFRKRFAGACLAAILCLIINLPHYTRNYMGFRNPMGAHGGTVSNFSIKSFAITFFLNINSNLAFPIKTDRVNNSLEKILNNMEADNTLFPYGQPKIDGIRSLVVFDEDRTKNFLQMILIIITFIILFTNKKGNIFYLLVLSSWCMFAYFIPWQPWITRLQMPLFALSAPAFSAAFENKDKIRNFFILLLSCFVILPLTLNQSRPLLSFPIITSSKTIWNTFRDDLVFINKHGDGSYNVACGVIVQAGIQRLGLIIGVDSWEYPLWRYIRNNSNKKIRITHVMENDIDNNIDALFILDRQTSNIIQNNDNLRTPMSLIRDVQNESRWKIIYRNTRNDN
jgi:hypothetical protein